MANELPAFDVNNAPLDQFVEPNSPMASILQQMQNASTRSNPQPQLDPQTLIQMLLAQRR